MNFIKHCVSIEWRFVDCSGGGRKLEGKKEEEEQELEEVEKEIRIFFPEIYGPHVSTIFPTKSYDQMA